MSIIRLIFKCILLSSTLTVTTPVFSQAHEPVVIENPEALPDAEFSLKIDDIVNPYDTFSVFVLPGQKVEFELLYPQEGDTYTLCANDQLHKAGSDLEWQWTAPLTPGIQKIEIKNQDEDIGMTINVFVMVPAEEVTDGRLKYYHIGHYPEESEIRNKEMYIIPEGFIEVTEENMNTRLSPHFRLKEFISKQRSGFPKFVYLQTSLLLKLEKLRRELNINNVQVDNMVVMSGYRTPYYNKAIGNVKFSRHVFGDAADVFIDNDGNYRMDDINGDGKFDIKDAEMMASFIESLNQRSTFKGLIGGLGVYGPKSHRGAFIHIDTRGVKARWRSP